MINPLVSILIPSYNSEKYIEQTILSCINQTYKNIEIIIVDDGSTDNSLNIIKNIAKKYSNIFIYEQKNSGAPTARNLAFTKSNGDYIQYLDSDDLLHKEKIFFQLKRLGRSDEKVMIFGSLKYFKHDLTNCWDNSLNVEKDYDNTKQFLLDLWDSSKSVLIHTLLTPRKLIQEVNGWDENILKNQDGVFFAKIIFNAEKILYDKNSISYCRIDNENSISRKKSFQSETSRLKSYEEYEKIFANYLSDKRVKKSLAIQYSDFIFNNYPENKELCYQSQKKIESLGFKEPIYENIKLYKNIAPIIGIYNCIKLHKYLSFLKQKILKYTRIR